MSEREVPAGMRLGTPELYRLQDTVGTEVCFGVAYPPGRMLGLGNDGHPTEWDVVVDLAEPEPWPVLYRAELFGETLEWVAAHFDDDPATAELADETICVVLVNRASLEAYVRSGDGYVVRREEFDEPGVISEEWEAGTTMRDALDDPIGESFFGTTSRPEEPPAKIDTDARPAEKGPADMDRRLHPLLPTPMPRDDPDGTTAWSDEVGLPGGARLLAWTVVQEADETFDIHVLWDTNDVHQAIEAAWAHARDFFGPLGFSDGIIWGTLNSADNAIRKRYDAERVLD